MGLLHISSFIHDLPKYILVNVRHSPLIFKHPNVDPYISGNYIQNIRIHVKSYMHGKFDRYAGGAAEI